MTNGDSQKEDERRFQELKSIVKRQQELADQERRTRRKRRAEFAFHVITQAIGTTIGAGIIGLIAIMLGVLKGVSAQAIILVGVGVATALVLASIVISIDRARPISREHAEYTKLLNQKKGRELGEKIARGEELTGEEHWRLMHLGMERDIKPRKKRAGQEGVN